MEAAGSGGTAELLSWFLVLAFTRGPADVLAYMPAVAWRSGTGMVAWNELAARRRTISTTMSFTKSGTTRSHRGSKSTRRHRRLRDARRRQSFLLQVLDPRR